MKINSKNGANASDKKGSGKTEQVTKGRVSQKDVPSISIDSALRVARALADHYAYKPATPLMVAQSLGVQPTTASFRMLIGASTAYGLTSGSYASEEISLEPLGLRITRPQEEGDDIAAKREALLQPKVVGDFLRKYDKAKLPKEEIGRNVLTGMGVPPGRAKEVYSLILDGAGSVGILRSIKDQKYVDLSSTGETEPPLIPSLSESSIVESPVEAHEALRLEISPKLAVNYSERHRKVFITHGKNRSFIDPIKKLLAFGELEPVIAIENISVSVPVPEKVMSDMRNCGAAIIHVDEELRLIDSSGKEHILLNSNVLTEIGAAMALYGNRFILLVKEGIQLPSNLQGLFQVRYSGDTLDGEATIKLLTAITDIKNHPLPGEIRP